MSLLKRIERARPAAEGEVQTPGRVSARSTRGWSAAAG